MCTVKEYRKDQWKISDPDNWGQNYVYIRVYGTGGVEVQGLDYVPINAVQMDVIITTLFLAQSRAKELLSRQQAVERRRDLDTL